MKLSMHMSHKLTPPIVFTTKARVSLGLGLNVIDRSVKA